MISVQHNMAAWYANRQFQLNKKDTAKGAEKLSSGYRINRAADDAAGLAISEKMRKRIRGLAQGSKNGQDGVSWTQIGDGALNEAHDIIHRMEELTIKSLNETNSDLDRAAMDSEFEWLKLELDRISQTTEFNEINIFEEHEPTYYQCEGGAKWDSGQMHVVTAGQNEITFKYRAKEDDPPRTVSFAVPPGEYTTMELLDELEDVIPKDNGDGSHFVLDYNDGGFVNASLENGAVIDSITGGLSYLIYDMYKGGSVGALIGTTIFSSEDAKLLVEEGKNDEMSFDVQYFDPSKPPKPVTIKLTTVGPAGGQKSKTYTRAEVIEEINKQLKLALGEDTTIKASPHGTGVKLGSNDAIVTGFTGNMFKIDKFDGDGTIYHSVFYDNVLYGSVTQWAAYFEGGLVLSTDERDKEHSKIVIEQGVNDTLSFEPNSKGVKYDLVIPPGEYDLDNISKLINDFCGANDIDIQAETYNQDLSRVSDTVDSTPVKFYGLKLISELKGPDSVVGIDKECSAYETLFVTRDYNEYGVRASALNETTDDKNATLTGGRTLSGATAKAPIKITTGNNQIAITITDNKGKPPYSTAQTTTSDTLKLKAQPYTSLGALITEINNQIANTKLAGKITAEKSPEGKIMLKGKDGECVNSISVSSGSSSYDTLFKNVTVSYIPQTNSGWGSISMDTTGKATSTSMNIQVGNTVYPVTLPSGGTKADIEQAIEEAIKPKEEINKNKFSTASATGSSTPRTVTASGMGKESVKAWKGEAKGNSTPGPEGMIGLGSSSPAVLTVDPPLKESMVVNSTNNKIKLTINKTEKELTLKDDTYTPQGLADQLQEQIEAAFGAGDGFGGAKVKVEDGKLVITANLPEGYDGKNTAIKCSTDSSSFLKYLNTTKEPAVCTSNLTLAPSISINSANNSFEFSYSEDGGKTFQTRSVQLSTGPYTPETFVTMLDGRLKDQGVRASLVNGRLCLTSVKEGKEIGLRYGSKDGGNSVTALFGDLTAQSPATVVLDKDIQRNGTIEDGKNIFYITVNGSKKPVDLKGVSWSSPSDFVKQMNDCLEKDGILAEAFLSGGSKLGFRTTTKGSSAKLNVSYNESANSAHEAIWGSKTIVTPGVDARWDGNKLFLTAVDAKGNKMPNVLVSVSSNTGGGLQPQKRVENVFTPTSVPGYHSTKFSYLDGVNLNGDVEINQYNNLLKFTFKDGGTSKDVSVSFAENEYKTYTYSELQEALQNKIDASLGKPGEIAVTVDGTGVRLQAKNAGSQYQFSNYTDKDNSFYWHVMCRCNDMSKKLNLDETHDPGGQSVKSAYIVGRKDVISEPAVIEFGVNNELSLELTYAGKKAKVELELDEGRYTGRQLQKHLQEKLDDWLVAHDMKKGVIQVGLGNINTGVAGGNDGRALNFSLSHDIQAPGEGQYIIEGVGGNAAFSIFYQTDGKITPAYIMGSKDISEGVTIKEDKTDLSFVVDGQSYGPINLPVGDYTTQDLLVELKKQFEDNKIPLVASTDYDTGRLKVSYNQVGEHDISFVGGGAKGDVFFAENGDSDDTVRHIQLSDVVDDKVELPRSEFSTAVMGIHSVCITRPKYARKALERLKPAVEKLSNLRSNFGSTQNRLEHAINNNNNTEENTQAAESAIRDADMAKQIVDYSNQKILEQVGQAMMAQANRSNEVILALLS